MKAQTLRNAVDAHAWVGLVISVPLFIIFWAGAITLFFPELQRWTMLPQYPIQAPVQVAESQVDYNDLIEQIHEQHDIAPDERVSIRLPNHRSPYLFLFFNEIVEPADEANDVPAKKEFVRMMLDPNTAELISTEEKFHFAEFLYHLHYDLSLPQGLYIVGVITLFFLVIIMTGIIVQLKNLIKHFFMYRKDSSMRNKMNDLHNVVGVISLPYGLMYAVTGLMFNLGILFQIPTAFLVYQGDFDRMLADAGFYNYAVKPTDTVQAMPDIRNIVLRTQSEYNAVVDNISIQNWGDETAVYRLGGSYNEGFSSRLDRFYHVASDGFPAEHNVPEGNTFATGLLLMFSIHFANFADLDLRVLFFILAIGVCAMIVAGNVLFIIKRQKKNAHPKTLSFMRALTLGGCVGIIPATALGFVFERGLPEALSERVFYVEMSFWLCLLAFVILSFFWQHLRRFTALGLGLSALCLCIVLTIDLTVFSQVNASLSQAGFTSVSGVNIGFALTALVLAVVTFWLLKANLPSMNKKHSAVLMENK